MKKAILFSVCFNLVLGLHLATFSQNLLPTLQGIIPGDALETLGDID